MDEVTLDICTAEYLLLKHTNRLSVKIILLHIVFYIQYPSIVIGWSIIIRATQGLMEPIIERASVKSKFVLTTIFVSYVPLISILEIGHTHVTTLYTRLGYFYVTAMLS